MGMDNCNTRADRAARTHLDNATAMAGVVGGESPCEGKFSLTQRLRALLRLATATPGFEDVAAPLADACAYIESSSH
jgi:hypothetical protein